MSTEDSDMKLLHQAADQLIEHFDSVQIFASRHDMANDDGTLDCTAGRGNWLARRGQVREWMLKQDEASRADARKEHDDAG